MLHSLTQLSTSPCVKFHLKQGGLPTPNIWRGPESPVARKPLGQEVFPHSSQHVTNNKPS